MAGRGGPKLKEYRISISSVRQWLRELEFPGLIVTEIYGNSFGPCQCILPSINNTMLAIDDAENKIKWLVLNIGKLEEEQKHALQEEEKKKFELEAQIRRKSMQMSMEQFAILNNMNNEKQNNTESKSNENKSLDLESGDYLGVSGSHSSGWDKITIPKLEKYTGYDHPRPLFLFISNSNIEYELHSPNPPALHKIISSWIKGVKLSPQELKEFDKNTESNNAADEEMKAARRKKKAEEALAAKKADKKGNRKAKTEVQRPPEIILQFKLHEFHVSEQEFHNKSLLLVCSSKDGSADDFLYYGQTERVKLNNSGEVTFYKTLNFVKTEDENDLDIELKFALYDTDTDDYKKAVTSHQGKLLGDGYINLRNIIQTEELPIQIQLTQPKNNSSTLHSPLASPKAQERNNSESKQHETSVAELCIYWRERVSEGIVTDYKVELTGNHLPQTESNSYIIATYIQDFNTIKYGYQTNTEASNPNQLSEPVYQNNPVVQHWSRDDRLIRFNVYDSKSFDPTDELTGRLCYHQISFNELLRLKKETSKRQPIELQLTADNQDIQLYPDTALLIRVKELDENGHILPEEIENEIPIVKTEPEATVIAFKFSVNGLNHAAANIGVKTDSSLGLGIFNKNSANNYELINETELVPFNGNSLSSERVIELIGPNPDDSVHSSNNARYSNHSTNNKLLATNQYKICLASSAAAGIDWNNSPDILCSTEFLLNQAFVNSGFSQELVFNDKKDQPIEEFRLVVNRVLLGSVTPVELLFQCENLVKSSHSIRTEPSPKLVLYTINPLTKQLVLAGVTERYSGEPNPNFQTPLTVHRYSLCDQELIIRLYDCEFDGIELNQLTERDLIGETKLYLAQILHNRTLSLNLMKNNKPVNDNKAIVNIHYNYNNIINPANLNLIDNILSVADSFPRGIEFSAAEKTSFTTEIDPHNAIGLSFVVHDLVKADWNNGNSVLICVYKKNPHTGHYSYIDCTESINYNSNPKFAKLIVTNQHKGNQLFKFILIDANTKEPLQGNEQLMEELESFGYLKDENVSTEEYEHYRNIIKAAGHIYLGETIIDIQQILVNNPKFTVSTSLIDINDNPIAETKLLVSASGLGHSTPFQCWISAENLPNSHSTNQCNPILIVKARNHSHPTSIAEYEIARTNRLIGENNPVWSQPIVISNYDLTDRDLHFQIYDCNGETEYQLDPNLDLLGSTKISLSQLLQAAQNQQNPIELKLDNKNSSILKIRITKIKEEKKSAREKSRPTSSKQQQNNAKNNKTKASSAVQSPKHNSTKTPSKPNSNNSSRPNSGANNSIINKEKKSAANNNIPSTPGRQTITESQTTNIEEKKASSSSSRPASSNKPRADLLSEESVPANPEAAVSSETVGAAANNTNEPAILPQPAEAETLAVTSDQPESSTTTAQENTDVIPPEAVNQ